jgi:hypothetical protein
LTNIFVDLQQIEFNINRLFFLIHEKELKKIKTEQ